MDKVKFNPFSEILDKDFNKQAEYVGDAVSMFIKDFLTEDKAVVLGLDVKAQAVADMTVYVAPGRLYQIGKQGQLTVNSNPPLAITAAHPDYDRIDRICVRYAEIDEEPETRNVMLDTISRQVVQKTVMTRTTGTIEFMVVNGTAAPVPAAPTVPEGWVSLAKVTVKQNAPSIAQADITDERPTISGYLAHKHTGGGDGARIDYNRLLNLPDLTKIGNGESVGHIGFTISNIPEGCLTLDTGALISRETYPELWAFVQSNRNLLPVVTDAEWQTMAGEQTSVAIFSMGDGSTTFRLPKLLGWAKGGTQAQTGITHEAGLPNIEGSIGGTGGLMSWGNFASNGALQSKNIGKSVAVDSSNGLVNIFLDASKSNAIYGASTEVQPAGFVVMYYIRAFHGTANQGIVDVTALANEVNSLKTMSTPEIYVYTIFTTYSANIVTGNNTITLSGGINDVHVGQTVTGTGIMVNTTVAAVNRVSGEVILSNTATVTENDVTLTFTKSDGMYTHTVPNGKNSCEVTVTGGGGGGASGGTPGYGCSSGAAAGTSIKSVTGLKFGNIVPVTVGGGGLATSSSGNGTNGGTSSFGIYCSATGGSGGKYTTAGSAAVTGGIGIGGDINIGGGGSYAYNIQSDGDDYFTGGCPASYWGGGQASRASLLGTPAFGAGGRNNSIGVGGQGGQGIVVVKYY